MQGQALAVFSLPVTHSGRNGREHFVHCYCSVAWEGVTYTFLSLCIQQSIAEGTAARAFAFNICQVGQYTHEVPSVTVICAEL